MERILLCAYFFFSFFWDLRLDPWAPSNSVESLSWWSRNKRTVLLLYKLYSKVRKRRYLLGLRGGKSSGWELRFRNWMYASKYEDYSSLSNLITLINFPQAQWCLSNISQNKHGFRFKIFKIASCGHGILLIYKGKWKFILHRTKERKGKVVNYSSLLIANNSL